MVLQKVCEGTVKILIFRPVAPRGRFRFSVSFPIFEPFTRCKINSIFRSHTLTLFQKWAHLPSNSKRCRDMIRQSFRLFLASCIAKWPKSGFWFSPTIIFFEPMGDPFGLTHEYCAPIRQILTLWLVGPFWAFLYKILGQNRKFG